jgi:vanillate O-demethylase ferredoxin subunit
VSQKVRIVSVQDEAPDIKSFILESADDKPLAGFEPGAHVDVKVADGISRSYSLINTTECPHQYHIAVKREADGRGGSAMMHTFAPGQLLDVSEPRNNFPLADPRGRSILVAGGIGITPIYGMAKSLAQAGEPFELHYLARTEEAAAFVSALKDEFGDRLRPAFGLDASRVSDYLGDVLGAAKNGDHLYICGPKPLMDLGRDLAARNPALTLHLEYFSADTDLDPLPKGSFQVKLARSGRTITIPEGRSIVDVLADHDIEVETSCEQGICGACLTKVLEGTPDHRDMLLTDEEHAANDQMTVCVSRSIGPLLVLDL